MGGDSINGVRCIPGTNDGNSCSVDQCSSPQQRHYETTEDVPYFEWHPNCSKESRKPESKKCSPSMARAGNLPKGTVVADLIDTPQFETRSEWGGLSKTQMQWIQPCGVNSVESAFVLVDKSKLKPLPSGAKAEPKAEPKAVWYKPWTWF